jgi:hypothetical protein
VLTSSSWDSAYRILDWKQNRCGDLLFGEVNGLWVDPLRSDPRLEVFSTNGMSVCLFKRVVDSVVSLSHVGMSKEGICNVPRAAMPEMQCEVE